ncbi:MAG: LysR family transcriptional regulator [Methylotenera sp.]|nr:LysR family transcriptional regulator [Oligoflexia bacterium]
METDKLKWFAVIAQTSHLRRASEMLNVAPGTLSKAIRSLEAQLKVKLIQNEGRGIILTSEGVRVARLASAVLDAVLDLSIASTKVKAPIRIASFEVFTAALLPQVLSQLENDSSWALLEKMPGAIEKAILELQADFGLTYAPVPHPDLDFLHLGSLQFGVYGNARLLESCAFDELPFVIPLTPVQGDVEQIRNLDGWPEDWPRKVPYQFELLASALAIAQAGKAVLYCPSVVVELHNRDLLAGKRLDKMATPRGFPESSRRIYLIKRRSDPEDRFLKRFAKEVRVALKAENPQ